MGAPGLLVRALAVWLAIMAAETLQGLARRILFGPEIAFAVRQASVLTGVVVIYAIVWVTFPWTRLRTARDALATGLAWALLTLAFEVGLGLALKVDPAVLRADYDLLHGGLMPLGLAALALAPWVVLRLRRPALPSSPETGS